MKLVEFSVSNYRSITTANKIELEELTVLEGLITAIEKMME